MSITYTQSKRHDEAIVFAEKTRKLSKRKVFIPYINNDPRFDPVRSDPRFIELLMKIGLDK
jgi:hypothetical protein